MIPPGRRSRANPHLFAGVHRRTRRRLNMTFDPTALAGCRARADVHDPIEGPEGRVTPGDSVQRGWTRANGR